MRIGNVGRGAALWLGVSAWCRGLREAELEQDTESVRDPPVLNDSSVGHATNVEDVRSHFAARRGVAHERAVVYAGADHAEPDFLAVDGDVPNLEVEI
jgi:hypothetical protein